MRNKIGGYLIAAQDPSAAREALTGTFDLTGYRRRLLAMSDGFAAAYLTHSICDSWTALLRLMLQTGLGAILSAIRTREAANDSYVRSDDASAILVESTHDSTIITGLFVIRRQRRSCIPAWLLNASRHWLRRRIVARFFGGFKVVIYLPLRENERRLVIANEDFLSALDLSNFLRRYGIVSTVQEIPPRGES